MTKFLSKLLLSGILLSSINGYCSNTSEWNGTNIYARIDESNGNNKNTVELSSDYSLSMNITVGIDNFENNNGLPDGYSLLSSNDNQKKSILHEQQNEDTVAATKINNGCWELKNNYKFNKAEINFNEKQLTIGDGKVFTVTYLGQLNGPGTIQLTKDNKLVLQSGSTIGGTDQKITILGNENDNNEIDLTKYISLSQAKDSVSFDASSKNINLNLENKQNIKLFDVDNIENIPLQNQNAIIESFNNTKETLFPNITIEQNNTNLYPTLIKVPYLFVVNGTIQTKEINTETFSGGKIGIKSILLDKIFDNNNIKGNIRMKFGSENKSSSEILEYLLEETQNMQISIDLNSFIKYDNGINILDLQTPENMTLIAERYELTSAVLSNESGKKRSEPSIPTANFQNTQISEVIEEEPIPELKITNLINSNYVPTNGSGNKGFYNSNVNIVGSNDSTPAKIGGITLDHSTVTITGDIHMVGILLGDENSSLNIQGKVTLEALPQEAEAASGGEGQQVVEEQPGEGNQGTDVNGEQVTTTQSDGIPTTGGEDTQTPVETPTTPDNTLIPEGEDTQTPVETPTTPDDTPVEGTNA